MKELHHTNCTQFKVCLLRLWWYTQIIHNAVKEKLSFSPMLSFFFHKTFEYKNTVYPQTLRDNMFDFSINNG